MPEETVHSETRKTPPPPPLIGEVEEAHARGGWGALLPLLAPLWGGFLLDVTDFFSWAVFPPSIVMGVAAGVPLGWWIASTLGFSQKWRLITAIGAGVYCFLPFTELLPLATIASTVASLVKARSLLVSQPGTKRG
jgi:hypothetical protein